MPNEPEKPVNNDCKAARYPGDVNVVLSDWSVELVIDGIYYRRHPNGGGWVAETAKVAPTAFVGIFALICDTAQVSDNAEIFGRACVYGHAKVCDNAKVHEDALVYDDAEIYGHARNFRRC